MRILSFFLSISCTAKKHIVYECLRIYDIFFGNKALTD